MSVMISMGSKAKVVAELDVKGDFPVLKRSVRGKPIVYVDSAATSQKPTSVLAAENPVIVGGDPVCVDVPD